MNIPELGPFLPTKGVGEGVAALFMGEGGVGGKILDMDF